MRIPGVAILTAILPVLSAASSVRAQESPDQLAITGVTVIDVVAGRSVPDQTVVVRGSRIVSVSRTGRIRIPADARRINGRGKYVIPGLWDMHAHALSDNRSGYAFPLLIANGVTGIREMGSNMPIDSVNQIRRDVESHRILGPRFGALTYRIIDGSPTTLRIAYEVSDPSKAREVVREYKRKGADFIKPYNQLRRDVYLALVDEARNERIPLEGHVPFSITAGEASDLGQRTIEHNWDVLLSASAKEDSLRRELAVHPELWGPIEAKAAASYDERKAKKLFAQFARNHTWSCPTIAFYRIPILLGTDSAARADSVMKYVPQAARDIWSTNFQRLARMSLPGFRKVHYQMRSSIVREEQRAGVGILAGTDAGAAYTVHGFSLHNELQALVVDAGLSPLDALRAATINPARFFGQERELGTVAKGKLADLVLLDANPLQNIRNTRRISAVVADGRYLPRDSLDAMLAQAAAMVR